jgi:hypothetical protein
MRDPHVRFCERHGGSNLPCLLDAARSGLDGCEHGATLDQVGPAAASLSFRGVLVAATSAFENLVSHPTKDLTAGRKSNATSMPSRASTPSVHRSAQTHGP